ncbi:hypothetical protein EW146_g6692 [Bondarzewia mesenterica]|uniref:NADP-dependent oxidoreductase domain-containing protein n=1 Tax=Bondarzewia mesenterica TaxID=1095465 RepID=A0A4S4LNR8_9AGAM|nr:hypothetical protein EW146_g6692 [Bondarzewia mesenterica]
MSIATAKKMPYVRLGSSGLKVSQIILGTLQYGDPNWQGWVLPEEEAVNHIKAAYDAGIQTFDTADTYSNGMSEVVLGKAIKKWNLPRDEIVVMTKMCFVVGRTPSESYITVTNPDGAGYVNQTGLSRKHIFSSVKQSLERLQLDYIDVLQCHRFDSNTPIAEIMQALHDVVKAGYVRYIGMSSCWAYQCAAFSFTHLQRVADRSLFDGIQSKQCKVRCTVLLEIPTPNTIFILDYAIANKLTPFISMQNHYSLLYREEEREMFPTLKMFDVGAIPWSPLARGLLTRPLNSQTKRTESDPYALGYPPESGAHHIINRVEEISKKRGISMAQVALAWMISKEGVSAPIVGPTSLKNLHDLIEGVHVKLTEEEIKYLEEPYKSQAVRGHM